MTEPPPDRYDTPKPPPATAFEWTPELASGRVPGAEPPPEPIHRIRLATIWLLSALAVFFIATVSVGIRDSPGDAFESGRSAGRVVGTALAAFILAFLLWGVRVLFASRHRRRLLASPMVPLLAVLISLVSMFGAGRPASGSPSGGARSPSATPAVAHTLAEALAIRAPYVAREPDEAERQALLVQMGDLHSYKSVTVRRILEGDAFVAYAVLGETDLRPGAEALAITAFELALAADRSASPGWTETRTQVKGKTVLRITGDDGNLAVWTEPPYVKLVFAFTGTTLDSVVANFVNP